MFGNRKRKLEDEEESLVPHGLIWHATAEPTPEEVKKSEEALGYTINYAQEIELVRRQQSAQPVEQVQDVASQAPPAKPAAVPWWRVERPEAPVERPISKLTPMPLSAYVPTPIEPAKEPALPPRIHPMEVRPTPVQPINAQRVAVLPAAVPPIQAISTDVSAAPPAHISRASAPQVKRPLATSAQVQVSPISTPVICNPAVAKPPARERLVPKSSEITAALVEAWSRIRSAGKIAWLSLGSITAKALQRVRQTVESLELGAAVARAGKRSQNLIQGAVARTSHCARITGRALSALSQAGVSRLGQMSAKVRQASTAATTDVVRAANTLPPTPSRIRLLLAASALQAKIIAAQQLSAWKTRRERVAIDSRFWASMTMSAIAAVIALVIVSVVPHYAAKSLPSRLLNTNPSVDANTTAPINAAPAPVKKTVTPILNTATLTGAKTIPAKTDLEKPDSVKSATNPKPKHVNDDYVAPNTYKYYGNGSKASH
jgi:hypothetical protein